MFARLECIVSFLSLPAVRDGGTQYHSRSSSTVVPPLLQGQAASESDAHALQSDCRTGNLRPNLISTHLTGSGAGY